MTDNTDRANYMPITLGHIQSHLIAACLECGLVVVCDSEEFRQIHANVHAALEQISGG